MRTVSGFFRVLFGLFGLLLAAIAWLVILSQTHPDPTYEVAILLLLIATALTGVASMLLVTRRVVRPMTLLTNNLEALVTKRTEALESANTALMVGDAKLRASEQRYRTLFDSAGEAIFILDDDHFMDCNRQTLEMFRADRDDILGHSVGDFSPETQPDGRDSTEAARDKLRATAKSGTQKFEWMHTRKDGTLFQAAVTLTLIQMANRPYVLAVVRDISDRKRDEQELHARVAELERFNRLSAEREVRLMEVKHKANEVAVTAGLPQPFPSGGTSGIADTIISNIEAIPANPTGVNYTLDQLIDIPQLGKLMEQFHKVTGFANAVIDNDGKVFAAAGWQRACTQFHRANSVTCAMCIKSDQYILEHLHDGPYVGYCCANGLSDYAVPIIIEGQHVANLFTGQMLHAPPDLEFFRTQAARFGFDESDYLSAIREVPIIPKEQIEGVMLFLTTLANMLAQTGLARRTELEGATKRSSELRLEREAALNLLEDANEAWQSLHRSEAKLRLLLDSTAEALYGTDMNGRCTFCNPACVRLLGFAGPEDLLGKDMHTLIHDAHPDGSPLPLEHCALHKAFRSGEGRHLVDEWFRRANGTFFAAECRSEPQIENGIITGSVVAFSDISVRREAEEENRRQMNELRRWHSTTLNRENRVLELKNEINRLLEQCGTPPKYFAGGTPISPGLDKEQTS